MKKGRFYSFLARDDLVSKFTIEHRATIASYSKKIAEESEGVSKSSKSKKQSFLKQRDF